MKFNKLYNYTSLNRVTNQDGSRYYVSPDGLRLPSVTTILSATGDKTQLNEWKKRVGAVKAEQSRNEATALGTLMHEHLECYVLGKDRPRGNNLIRKMSRSMADVIIKNGLCSVDEIWGVEVPLYFPGLYAGTTDLVGVYNGKPAIMDFKTAKRMRKREQISDYFGQLCAYALSHDELFNTNIQQGVVFMVSRDLTFEAFVVEGQNFIDAKMDFLERLDLYMETDEAKQIMSFDDA